MRAAVTLTALLCLWLSDAAHGQSAWPERTVSIVVPAAAGGSADVLARHIANALEHDTGQAFIVLNRPGGNNLIGTRVVVTAKPDGYTLLAHGVGAHVVQTNETPDAFDPDKDFSHLVYIGGIPAALVASKVFPADDIGGLVALSHKTAGGLSWASPGLGTRSYIVGEMFKEQTHADLQHIPYKGAGQAVAEVAGNQVPIGFLTLTSVSPMLSSGLLKGLAVSALNRLPSLPAVPTFKEKGYPALTGNSWFGISGPPNMPPALRDTINRVMNRALAEDDVKKFLDAGGFETNPMSAAEFQAFFVAEVKLMAPYLADIK